MYIGQELPELTPVEIVGCEVCEAGSPLALDDGWFTSHDTGANAAIPTTAGLAAVIVWRKKTNRV